MKFLCDQMLANLGKWLRAAGYDTEIIETPTEDQKIYQRAVNEQRVLLTRDRTFPTDEKIVLILQGNSVASCVQELNHVYKLNWLFAPFSRCLKCNSLLVVPDAKIIAEQAPAHTRATLEELWYCPKCRQVYWKGSHTEHMLEQLEKWQTI